MEIDLSAFADLTLGLGELRKEVKRLRLWQAKPEASFMRFLGVDPIANGVAPASGIVTFDLGSPTDGTDWFVRSVMVGGTLASTSPAGVAFVFASGAQPPSPGPLVDLRDTFTTFPAPRFYGRGEMQVSDTEHLWVRVTGGTNGTQYVAAASVEVAEKGQGVHIP